MMRYRTLGRTGLSVSELGMGGMTAMGKCGAIAADGSAALPGGAPAGHYRNIPFYTVAAEGFACIMRRAAESGINFLDTAPSYGDSETALGHYLGNPNERPKWLVSTKVGVCGSWGSGETMSQQEIVDQYSESLDRMRIDRADLLLIHSIDQYGQGEEAVARLLAPGGIVDALQELKRAGRIRCFGASGHLAELVPAVKTDVFDVVLTYNTFNLLVTDAADELLPLARARNLGVILGGAFYQGFLTGTRDYILQNKDIFYEKEDPAYRHTAQMQARARKLLDFVGGDGAALRRLALRFALSEPAISCVVVGMKSVGEVEENVSACREGPLTDRDHEQVQQILADSPVLSWTE